MDPAVDTAPQGTPKCLVLGDPGVGKTSLLLSLLNPSHLAPVDNTIPYTPARLEYFVHSFKKPGQEYSTFLGILDSNQNSVSPIPWQDLNAVVLCFSLVDEQSFARVENHWVPLIRGNCRQGVPIFLVGTKADLELRSDQLLPQAKDPERKVSREEVTPLISAEKLGTAVGAVGKELRNQQKHKKQGKQQERKPDPSGGNLHHKLLTVTSPFVIVSLFPHFSTFPKHSHAYIHRVLRV